MAWVLLPMFALLGWFLLARFARTAPDQKEPPLIPQKVPYIGHLIQLLRDGSRYYTRISSKYSLPIYTLHVPGKNIYVVNSPSLVAAVDRQSKTLSFAPYVVEFAKRILVPSSEGVEILRENLHEDGAWGCRPETLKAMHAALAPGKDLENTTRDILHSLSNVLDPTSVPGGDKFGLFSWTRKLITRISTDAIYGASRNPFQDPVVQAGFWAIEKDFAYLGLNILPTIIAPRGQQGRKVVFQAFREYYAQEGHLGGSRIVQARYEVNRRYGVSTEDIAQFDLSLCIGLLVNTVPATSWALCYMYSQPVWLEDARAAISSYIRVSGDCADNFEHQVDIAEFIAGYPLLGSFVQEILRIQSTNASGRVVLKDTLLEDQYLLKQDSMLLIPSAELHSNASVWGPSCKDFDPHRFTEKRFNGIKKPASAYRAFGGGATVCPGRFLATNEIMIILVMMMLKYDLKPAHGGQWVLPKSRPHITTSILTPVEDIQVEISERKGFEHYRWDFVWGGRRI